MVNLIMTLKREISEPGYGIRDYRGPGIGMWLEIVLIYFNFQGYGNAIYGSL
jgi:hypothetical protein